MNISLVCVFCIVFVFTMATLGSLCVFFSKRSSRVLNLIILGSSSGIMFSASIFSLILPALNCFDTSFKVVPVLVGIILGALFLVLVSFFAKKLQKTQSTKVFNLFTAITLHNIPEGLAVGFALGSAILADTQNATISAIAVAVGIGLQNFPEGLAVALPIYNITSSKKKGFLFGFLSGIAEPLFAILGLFLASKITFVMPYLLSFSAGAMIFVVTNELLPEIENLRQGAISTWAFLLGFLLMMTLDVLL